MRAKLIYYTKEILTFLIVLIIAANAISYYKSLDLNNKPFSLKNATFTNGQKIHVQNKPLLVHFWATWCPTCKIEASNIQTLSESYQVITIAVKSGSDDEIKNYMNKHNYNYRVLNDQNAFIANEFQITAYPTTFIYDKDKNLIFSDVGYTSTIGLKVRMWLASF